MRIKNILILTSLLLGIHHSASGADNATQSDLDGSTAVNQPMEQHIDVARSRGLMDLTNVFIGKGEWSIGGSVSYSTHTNDSYQFLVIDDIYSEGYSFKVSPMFTYAYADNKSVGARLVYNRSLLKIDNASLSFGDEDTGLNLVAQDFYSLTHSYSAQAILRQYIPLGRSKRFALFNEVQLGVGGSESKFAFDSPVTGTFSRSQDYSLGLSPGVMAFASNRVVIEVSVGVLGLSYSHIEQVHNQVTVGSMDSKSMNFKVNILSIGFGLGFYI